MADVLGGIDRPDRGHPELVLQQHERDKRTEVGAGGQVPLSIIPVAYLGVDQAAEPGGGVVDELGEPGVAGHRVPFADQDGEQVQVGPGGLHERGADQLEELVQRQRHVVRGFGHPLEHGDGLVGKRGQDRLLVREVAVKQRVVDVGRGGQVAGGGGVEAALGEQGAGGGQDLAPPFGGRAAWPPPGGGLAWQVGAWRTCHRARCLITASSHRPVLALSVPSGTQ